MTGSEQQPERYRVGDLLIDDGKREVRRKATVLELPGLSYDLLLALVRAAPNLVSHDQVAEAVWGGRLVSPETITQRVKMVRDALGDSSEAPRYISLVRGRGYRLSAPVARLEPGHRPAARKYAFGAIVAAGVLAAAFWLFWSGPGSGIERVDRESSSTAADRAPTVAVLPFEDLSRHGDLDYISLGLSEALIHVLAQVPEIKVIARTSSFQFMGHSTPVSDIANALGVSHVLEGSVQESGGKLRVTAQFIDAQDSSHVWSKSFDRELEDIFAIQDEIASEVLSALRTSILDPSAVTVPGIAYRPSLEAFQHVVLGRRENAERDAESLRAAEAHFVRAIELDPEYAGAYVGLADTLDSMVYNSDISLAESIDRRTELIETALQLDPDFGPAYAARAKLLRQLGRPEMAERDFNRALELNPSNAEAHQFYSMMLNLHGRYDEALEHARRAAGLSPLDPSIQDNLAQALWVAGRRTEAMVLVRRNVERAPDQHLAYWTMSSFLTATGALGEAQWWRKQARTLNPAGPSLWWMYCYGFLQLDALEQAESCAEDLLETYPDKLHGLYARNWLEVFKGNWDSAVSTRRAIMDKTIDDRNSARLLADFLGWQGDFQAGLAVLTDAYPELLAPGLQIGVAEADEALVGAALFNAVGNFEQRDRLLDAIEAVDSANPGRAPDSRRRAYIQAILGDRAAALASFDEFFQSGRRGGWWRVEKDWKLAGLQHDPELRRMLDEVKKDVRRQRAWFEAHQNDPLADILKLSSGSASRASAADE